LPHLPFSQNAGLLFRPTIPAIKPPNKSKAKRADEGAMMRRDPPRRRRGLGAPPGRGDVLISAKSHRCLPFFEMIPSNPFLNCCLYCWTGMIECAYCDCGRGALPARKRRMHVVLHATSNIIFITTLLLVVGTFNAVRAGKRRR